MKKILLVGVLVFTMALGAFAVYADSPNDNIFADGRGYNQNYGHMRGYYDEGYGHMMGNDFNREIDLNYEDRQQWINESQEDRTEYREERIKNAIENGAITQEQAIQWREHFAERDELYEENEYRGSFCHGGSAGSGYGRGMMNGYSY